MLGCVAGKRAACTETVGRAGHPVLDEQFLASQELELPTPAW